MQKAPLVGAFFYFLLRICIAYIFDRICSKNIKTTKEFPVHVDNYYDGDEAAGAYRNLHLLLKDKYYGCY